MTQNVLRFGIKLDGLTIESLFERMPDQRFILVVLDAYSVWPVLAAVVRPRQKPGQYVLRPLQPCKADHRDGCGFRSPFFGAAPCKFINLFSRVLPNLFCRSNHRLPGNGCRSPSSDQVGRRTLIRVEDAEAWLASRPSFHNRQPERGQ